MYNHAHRAVAENSQSTQDPRTANHHWYPFLRYQEECAASGKEATLDDWMRSTGKLKDKIDFETRKAAAAAQEAAASKAKPKPTADNKD